MTALNVAFFFIGGDKTGHIEAADALMLPDSGLRGANFFAQESDIKVSLVGAHALETRLPRVLRKILPMSLVQLAFIPRLMRYDAVIASDGFLLGYAVSLLTRLTRRKAAWIFVAINSSVLIRRHEHHAVRRALLKRAWRSYAAIVCLSKVQKEDLERFGIPSTLLHEIRFGTDARYFTPAFRKEGEYILSVGKDLGRDYQTLLAAAKETGLPVRVIAAPKNIPLGTAIPENVTLSYNLPLEELRDAYARARLFVVASLPEGTEAGTDCSGQTVILEAMAVGVPGLATRRDWLAEYFTEGEEYVAVPPLDAPALARRMRELWGDEELAEGVGRAGSAKVRRDYTSAAFAGARLRLVRSVV